METTPVLQQEQARHSARGDDHARTVRSMFDRIAIGYDLLNHLLSFGLDTRWRKIAVRDFAFDGMDTVVDACGGTGDLTLALRRRLPHARVLCVDFSHEMLKVSRGKLRAAGLYSISGDALRIPVDDGSVDGVMCAFGIRNVSDLDTCLNEFHRIIRPGGRVLILEFMAGQTGLFHTLFRCYFRIAVPLIGRLISKDRKAYTYLPNSVEGFVTADEMAGRMSHAGLSMLKMRHFSFGAATEFVAEKRLGG